MYEAMVCALERLTLMAARASMAWLFWMLLLKEEREETHRSGYRVLPQHERINVAPSGLLAVGLPAVEGRAAAVIVWRLNSVSVTGVGVNDINHNVTRYLYYSVLW